MHVYFVRHGETDLNRQRVHQTPNTPINARGLDQARVAGEMLRPMNATLLLSSTYERAAQTARTIGLSVGLTPTYSSLLHEVGKPTEFAHTPLLSVRAVWYVLRSAWNQHDPKWHYKDGENFPHIYERIDRTRAFIESCAESHASIIVVSHSVYLSLMMNYMCKNKALTLRELTSTLLSINTLKNCGIYHLEYVGPVQAGACAWVLHGEK